MAMTTVLLSPLYRGRITGNPASKGGCAAIKLHVYLSYAAYGRSALGLTLTTTLSPVSATGAVGVAMEAVSITDIKPLVNVTFATAPCYAPRARAHVLAVHARRVFPVLPSTPATG